MIICHNENNIFFNQLPNIYVQSLSKTNYYNVINSTENNQALQNKYVIKHNG